MGYKECLELAGAKVLEYEEFGSYQGYWVAYVKYQEKTGFIKDTFGSCSESDAYQSEFDDSGHKCIDGNHCAPHYFGYKDNCKECQKEKQKAIEFGKEYLGNIIGYKKALEEVSINIKWDADAQDMVDFVKKCKELYELN